MKARIATSRKSSILVFFTASLLVALGAFAPPVHAANSVDVGRVLVAAGDTVAIRGSQAVPLKYGSTIQDGDALRTGQNSNLQVRFIDDSVISMKESSELRIDNFKFNPTPITVCKGTDVTWTNHDDIPHSIVLNSLGVRSKAMDTDGTFTYRFDKTGTLFYVCGLHPYMQAKVVVK